MHLLDKILLNYKNQPRSIELIHGDLTAVPPSEKMDILVISAYPGSYAPIKDTMMESLQKQGISVAELAQNKAEDMRDTLSCWISKEINHPGFGFKRILCFEPPYDRGTPPDVVGDIFQSITAVLGSSEQPLRLAMPLVSTGSRGYEVAEMLEPLLEAAINNIQHGLPIECLKIVQRSNEKAWEMKGAFAMIKRRYQQSLASRYGYDLFISYCWSNASKADFLMKELTSRKKDLRIFLDRNELNTGTAWQQGIYDALENCARVVALYSPDYLKSKMCKEEFNIAVLRNRDADGKVLLPLYLQTANLPSYMRIFQYMDCREADEDKLRQASDKIIAEVEG